MLLTHINIACTHKFSNAALQQIPSEKYISCHLKKDYLCFNPILKIIENS